MHPEQSSAISDVTGWAGGSGIWYPGGRVGTVHSAHKEAAMEEYSLTLGAHLLLWAFPLVLVILVVAEDLHDRFKSGSER